MACLTALYSQTLTLFFVPHEILFLQHKVFREYAKIAVGPDFIHTLPSFLILMAMACVLWRNPPSMNSVSKAVGSTTLYKALQVSRSKPTEIVFEVMHRTFVVEGHGQLGGRHHGYVGLADPSKAPLLLRLDVLELRV
ncbi:uncharacterized protein LOC128872192 [Hylaeus volcanicus]|uniref:uncharacterized protein LOC128872192 n=1 Tax=Hylaeus volcanicus TaxID=313075 RepID=UPI0023B82C53|nr:uncharacterized protein LOC128872192 [Hylaeus volcanicus]